MQPVNSYLTDCFRIPIAALDDHGAFDVSPVNGALGEMIVTLRANRSR
jgi:hypothetical protein